MMGRNTGPVIEKALNSSVLSYMKYDIQIRSVDARAYDSIVVPCASSETRGCTKVPRFYSWPVAYGCAPWRCGRAWQANSAMALRA